MSLFSLLKKLAGETFIYGVSNVVSRFISIFLTPVYTGIFAPSDYGLISLTTMLFALLSIVLILGLDNGLARWYYDGESEDDRQITINTFLWSCCAVALLLAFVTIVFRDFISTAILRESRISPLLTLMAINLPLSVFQVFTVNVLRMRRRAAMTAVFTLTMSLLTIGLTLLFVVVMRMGLSGVFYAQIGTGLVGAAWSVVLFRREISLRFFDFKRWRELFLFGMPLIPATVAFWVINISSAYFIQLINNTREVGLFQIGVTVAGIAGFVSGAFQLAWGPFAYSIYKRPEARQIYAQVLLIYLSTVCLLSLGVMLFAPEILIILTNPNYYDAAFVGGLLGFNHVLIGLTYIASIGIGIAKNTKIYGVAMLVSAGLLVALNFILIPQWGKEGAAVSILISQAVVPLAVFIRGQKIYPIPYKFGKAFLILSSSFIIGVAAIELLNYWAPPLTVGISIKVLILAFYCALLFLAMRSEIKTTNLSLEDTPTV